MAEVALPDEGCSRDIGIVGGLHGLRSDNLQS